MFCSPAGVLAFFFPLLEDTPAADVEDTGAAAVEEAVGGGGAGSGVDQGTDVSSSSRLGRWPYPLFKL